MVIYLVAISFRDLLRRIEWRCFEEYVSNEQRMFIDDAVFSVQKSHMFRDSIRNIPEVEKRIKSVSPDIILDSLRKLSSGRVVGVDGTISIYPTPVGYRCRIGVVAVNYLGERVGEALYVSDLEFIDEGLNDITELLRNIEELCKFTPLLYKCLMMYKERELVLNRSEEWKVIHGPIVPLEMRLGRLGVENVLEENIKLAERLVMHKKIIGVLSSTRRLRLLNLGYLLKPGEYMRVASVGKLMRSEKRRLTREEESLIDGFIENYGDALVTGIYKASGKAYVFESHRDYFDEAAGLIIADSLNNRTKGFPFLIDYADKVCHSLFSSEEFKSRFEQALLSAEGEEAFMSFDERRMRWS